MSASAAGLSFHCLGRGQAGHAPDDLTGHAERLAAGGQDLQSGAIFEQALCQVRSGFDQVLAVVQEQQDFPLAQVAQQEL